MKRTPLKRKTPLKAKTGLKRSNFNSKPRKAVKRRKGKSQGKLLAWIKAIPESQAHGSGTYQKRLWKLTSDYVRIRDWYKYNVCVATGKVIEHWKDGQAGHLKPYGTCNGIYKFDVRNIHLQSASSNKWGNRDTWIDYEKVVRNRGYDFDKFEKENQKATGIRLYDSDVVEQMKVILKKMKKLPEQPDYYQRAVSLLKEATQE